MMSIWNNLFDLVLDFVLVDSKVSESCDQNQDYRILHVKKKSKINMGHLFIDNNCTSEVPCGSSLY